MGRSIGGGDRTFRLFVSPVITAIESRARFALP
jgi:hypothetical protein